MAEEQPSQEKTEEPTERKKTRARDEGQLVRSRELNSMALVVAGAIGMLMLAPWGAGRMISLTSRIFASAGMPGVEPFALLRTSAQETLLTVVPFLLLIAFAGVMSSVAVGGFVLAPKAMAFKAERMSLLKGFKRMFSARSLVELVKSIAKVALIAGVAVLTLSVLMEQLLYIGGLPIKAAVSEGMGIVGYAMLLIGSSLVVVAVIDVPFQIAQHNKQLKMTRQEVKDEMKETEGKPEVKSRIRQLQQEISRRRMLEDVPAADVVITNPEHFSVAIRYDPATMPAPLVVARGADHLAFRIREIAAANGVPILAQPVLARAVYFNAEVGDEVPAGLYVAVAQVLAYIYQLRQADQGRVKRPGRLAEIDVPPEFFVESENE